jgi:hypothetical protein
MKVSLEEAIEIHAKVLKSWHKDTAPTKARDHAAILKQNGDHEGHAVWLRVADVAERLGKEPEKPRSLAGPKLR